MLIYYIWRFISSSSSSSTVLHCTAPLAASFAADFAKADFAKDDLRARARVCMCAYVQISAWEMIFLVRNFSEESKSGHFPWENAIFLGYGLKTVPYLEYCKENCDGSKFEKTVIPILMKPHFIDENHQNWRYDDDRIRMSRSWICKHFADHTFSVWETLSSYCLCQLRGCLHNRSTITIIL